MRLIKIIVFIIIVLYMMPIKAGNNSLCNIDEMFNEFFLYAENEIYKNEKNNYDTTIFFRDDHLKILWFLEIDLKITTGFQHQWVGNTYELEKLKVNLKVWKKWYKENKDQIYCSKKGEYIILHLKKKSCLTGAIP